MRILTSIGILLLAAPAVLGQQDSRTPLDLKGAIALALMKNPAVISAERAADGSAARVSAAKSAAGFNLSLLSNYGHINKATVFNGIPILEKNTLTNGLVLEKLVFSGGKVKSEINQAKYMHSAAKEASLSVKDAVSLRVAENYYKARMSQEKIAAARLSIDALKSSYDAALKLRDAGVVTKADVLRAEVELTTARERLLAAENGLAVALAALKTAVGLDQDEEIQLAENPDDPDDFDFSKIQPKERHDITSLKEALSASENRIKAARSSSLPQVYLQADIQNIVEGAFFPRQDNTRSFGLAVRMPVWDSGAARSAVSEAISMRDKTAEDLRTLVQTVDLETKAAKLDLENAYARLKTTESQLAAAEESLRVLQAGYKEGITPLTDLLAAESALMNARSSRIATTYDIRTAQIKLLASIGRLDLLSP